METSHPPAWLPDPLGRYQFRYWDGAEWTDQVSTNGSHERDPLGLAPGPAPVAGVPVAHPVSVAPRPRPAWSAQVQLLVFGGAALMIVGSLLPWVKAEAGFLTVTKNGIDGDGTLTLVLAGMVALLFALLRQATAAGWIVVVLGGFAGAIALYDTIDVSQKADELTNSSSLVPVSASVGVGLWVTLAAAIVILVGGIVALAEAPGARA